MNTVLPKRFATSAFLVCLLLASAGCQRAIPLAESAPEDVPRFEIVSDPAELMENKRIKAPQEVTFRYVRLNAESSGEIERVRWTLLRLGINQVVQDEPVAASSAEEMTFSFSTASRYELIFQGFSANGKSGLTRAQFVINSDLLPTF